MYSILLSPDEPHRDELIAELWQLGTSGIIEDDNRDLRAFFEDSTAIDAVRSRYALISKDWQPEEGPSADFSRADWQPILVGDRFFVAPSWIGAATPEGRIRLTIDTSISFGSGRHETTQLALSSLEAMNLRGKSVFDIGCGSGILTAACAALGAGRIIGCDIDALAVRSAQRQFALPFFAGSADALPDQCADILLVNISAKVIDALASELKRIVKTGGTVLLAGFIAARTPACFTPRQVTQQGEWLCWTGSSEDLHAAVQPPGHILRHPEQWW